jgi:hypothetical protein
MVNTSIPSSVHIDSKCKVTSYYCDLDNENVLDTSEIECSAESESQIRQLLCPQSSFAW